MLNTTDILTLAGGIDKLEFVQKLEAVADVEYVNMSGNGLVSKYFIFDRDPLRYVRVSLAKGGSGGVFLTDALTEIEERYEFNVVPHPTIKDELRKMFDN